jgi:hypothetical protein
MPKFSRERPLPSSAAVDFGSAVFESLAAAPDQHLFRNICLGKKFSLAVRLIRPVLLVSALTIAPAWGQTVSGPPTSGIAFAGGSSVMQPGVTGVAPAGIPLGSTELQTHGESPAIIRPGITPLTGTGTAGSSGIPLGSTQLTNPGLSPSRRLVTPSGCSASASYGSPSRALPARLFDGNAPQGLVYGTQGQLPGSGMATSRAASLYAGCASLPLQTGIVTQQSSVMLGRTDIGIGATELTNNGLSGIIAAVPGQ